jgi:CIC family chloride channel protein
MIPLAVPGLILDPTTCMLAGIATVGVAIIGGPLTMSFLVLEATHNLEVTAGVLAACVVTAVVVRGAFGHSFATWRLYLRGETIRSANDVGWLRNLTVGRIMQPNVATIAADASIADCRRDFPLGSHPAICLIDSRGAYAGLIVLPEAFLAEHDLAAGVTTVTALAKHQDAVLSPTMNVKTALTRFQQEDAEVLAVVDSSKPSIVVGMLTEASANRRYVGEIDQALRGLIEHH